MIYNHNDLDAFVKTLEFPLMEIFVADRMGHGDYDFIYGRFSTRFQYWKDGEQHGLESDHRHIEARVDYPASERDVIAGIITDATDYITHEWFEYASRGSDRYFEVHSPNGMHVRRQEHRGLVEAFIGDLATSMPTPGGGLEETPDRNEVN